MRIVECFEQVDRTLEAELVAASGPDEQERERLIQGGRLLVPCSRLPASRQADAQPAAAGRPDIWRSSCPTVAFRILRCTTISSIP